MKRIKVSLSNLDDVVKRLNDMASSLSTDFTSRFLEKLSERGRLVAVERINSSMGDDRRNVTVKVDYEYGESRATLTMTSDPHRTKDGRTYYPHLGIEFGSGIHFNNGNTHPRANEFGMGVGTFPDQTHALDDFWVYRDEQNKLHVSMGTEGTRPMHNADIAMLKCVEEVAKEVWGGIYGSK